MVSIFCTVVAKTVECWFLAEYSSTVFIPLNILLLLFKIVLHSGSINSLLHISAKLLLLFRMLTCELSESEVTDA